MRKIPSPDDLLKNKPDRASSGGGRSSTRQPKLSEAEFESQYNALHEKVIEFLIAKWTRGSSVSLDVTAYHDDVIKKIRELYEETGAWKAERNLDRDETGKTSVFIRFKARGE